MDAYGKTVEEPATCTLSRAMAQVDVIAAIAIVDAVSFKIDKGYPPKLSVNRSAPYARFDATDLCDAHKAFVTQL
jgi:hypothetical protein